MTEEHNKKAGNKTPKAAEPQADERRRDVRSPLSSSVEAVDAISRTKIEGQTSDLSRGGCFVNTSNPYPAGSVVKMRFIRGKRFLDVRAEVIYALQGMGMGVKFVEAHSEHLKTVEKWVAEIGGDLHCEAELPGGVTPVRPSGKSAENNYQLLREILNEILIELMREDVLPNAKCETMLRKLNGLASSQLDRLDV